MLMCRNDYTKSVVLDYCVGVLGLDDHVSRIFPAASLTVCCSASFLSSFMDRFVSRIPFSSSSGSGIGLMVRTSPSAFISMGDPGFKPTFSRSFLDGKISPLDPILFLSTRMSDIMVPPKQIYFPKTISVSEV